jgi:cytochrome c-type protein NapC
MAGRFRRTWSWLRSPHSRYSAGFLIVSGMVLAALGWGGFSAGVAYSNTMEFCVSCHEMRDFPYAEYQKTHHYSSSSGVQATCPDCHVPRAFLPKMVRKIEASLNEVPKHFLGAITTQEKYEAHRLRMAEKVWASMKANDSRECRECHNQVAMALEAQRPRSRAQHQDALTSGETCIDCHKGVAHILPELPADPADDEQEDDFAL